MTEGAGGQLEEAAKVVEERIGDLKRGERMAKQWYTLVWLRSQPDWQVGPCWRAWTTT